MGAKRATVRFYAELNDFLPPDRRAVEVERTFYVAPTVKDLVEGLGVPHTEIDLILANGRPVDFSYVVGDGDRLGVYPVFESFDIAPVSPLRAEPLREVRFLADANLGQLARYLRLLGLDTHYAPDIDDPALAELSARDRRVLLTRDVELLKRKVITHGYFVRADDPRAQIVEVVRRFDLVRALAPLTRCANCNGELRFANKAEVADALESGTSTRTDDFRRCAECGQVYWKGSHHERIEQLVAHVKHAAME